MRRIIGTKRASAYAAIWACSDWRTAADGSFSSRRTGPKRWSRTARTPWRRRSSAQPRTHSLASQKSRGRARWTAGNRTGPQRRWTDSPPWGSRCSPLDHAAAEAAGVARGAAAEATVSATDAPLHLGTGRRARHSHRAGMPRCQGRRLRRADQPPADRSPPGTTSRSPGTMTDGSGTCRRFAHHRAGHSAAVPYARTLIALSESPAEP